ncbi:MAG: hypothetical protein A2538_02520 [Candidatus Magasanikbacteria bacterium RIFOXYD2_FULL_41_14]|uniref:BioF2-like acetyltransferase domain-containing protein n=1 Tax=Candidatus Magasanikbacteria bacterium RIFOXYD2_FULL_41_14 TaxID=1798709 RepID=A0A1F6PC46_9BACT|nr:MAG: hypothetical protein A2538_02520 [Candidatus Magasanikbacteria bacterium RIFOXYD2_FULL_41_14]
MEIKLINNIDEWLSKVVNASFAQSFEWGEILSAEGQKIERLKIVDKGQILALALVVYIDLPLVGCYAYCPKGPVVVSGGTVGNFEEALNKYFSARGCTFFRFEPIIAWPTSANIKKTIDLNPRATLVLDLNDNEEAILAGMHPKTRYNIRLAEKKGVVIKEEKNLDIFLKLMNVTGKRDNFGLHARGHYEAVLKNSAVKQLVAFFDSKPIATTVLIESGSILTYLYGASDYEYRHLMSPYLLQWEAIKRAKGLGSKFYDFFGVAPNIGSVSDYQFDSYHQYAGVTRFKLGFGGRYTESPGTYDFVIDKKRYWAYKTLRWIRRLV